MTAVYSGGLVYEYSQESSNYGLVTISGSSVTERDDFTALKDAYSGTPNPSGDGGAKTDGGASECPAQSSTWDVTGDSLPAIPQKAEQYMSKGAGKGAGLSGSGSQNAGEASSGTATPGSGSVTAVATNSGASGKSTSSSAASAMVAPELGFAPFAISAVVLFSTLFGALLV